MLNTPTYSNPLKISKLELDSAWREYEALATDPKTTPEQLGCALFSLEVTSYHLYTIANRNQR